MILLFFVALLSFQSLSPIVKVQNGGSFATGVTKSGGKVTTPDEHTQKGVSVAFTGGACEHIDGTTEITTRSTNKTIILDGEKKFRGNGQRMKLKFIFEGQDNRVEGDLMLLDDLDVQDHTVTMTYAGTRRLDKNIRLKGSKMFLEEDIRFNDNKKILGPGTIVGNGRRIIFGSTDFVYDTPLYFDNASSVGINSNVTLSHVWTFSGSKNRITGKGFVLTFASGGKIIVERGSTLILDDIVLDGVTTDNMYCKDNAGTIQLKNTDWLQSTNYTFSVGALQIKDHVHMVGEDTFVYQSPMQTVINRNSTLFLDNGYTFSYDVAHGLKDRIMFSESTSRLHLNGSTLYVTATGMQLKNGKLLAENDSTIVIDNTAYAQQYGGLTIGNDQSNDDTVGIILNAATLRVQKGKLTYKNVGDASWNMRHPYSLLRFENGSTLQLDQAINVGQGRLQVVFGSTLSIAEGNQVIGSIDFLQS